MLHFRTLAVIAAVQVAAAFCLSCGPTNGPNTPDPYWGYVDGTAFDSKFLPVAADPTSPVPPTNQVRCPGGACYPAQTGYVAGRSIKFYNLWQLQSSTAVSTASGGLGLPKDSLNAPLFAPKLATMKAYDLGSGCSAGPELDPVRDAYRQDVQYPVFGHLPLRPASTTTTLYPFVAVYGVTGLSSPPCNGIKTTESLGASDGSTGGKFSAVADADPKGYAIWAALDGTNTRIALLGPDSTALQSGWYKNMQLMFMNGGSIPVDPVTGNFKVMDGVKLYSGAPGNSRPTEHQMILLPKAPGDPDYSPIVRLHDFNMGTNPPGFYTGICSNSSGTCGPNDVPIELATASPFWNIFIVAAP